MPDAGNIDAPISLVSMGRSGTSLVSNILRAHPDVQFCGETSPLLFGTWEGAQRTRGHIPPHAATISHDARAAGAVQAAFLASFDAPGTPHWFQKPINVPWSIPDHLRDDPAMHARIGAGYWRAMAACFPRGQVITILRHPYDVLISAIGYWDNPASRIWRNMVVMARILTHPDSPVTLALRHAAFVDDPASEISRLLDHLGLGHHPACYRAPDLVYVPAPGRTRRPRAEEPQVLARNFAHRDRWADLDLSFATPDDRTALSALWAHFGHELAL